MSRPLLVVDGDSFAHRSYHALPKSIRRRGGGGAGAIVGFANFLLRLYAEEQPRAVLVGWDTLDAPTYRHQALALYQSGREFDAELLEQLAILPEFVAACGFAAAKAPGYEADDFLAAAVAEEERRGGTAVVASGDRDAFQLASDKTAILQPVRAGEMARIGPAEVRERYGVDPKQVPEFIALRGDPSDKIPGARGVGPKGLLPCCGAMARSKQPSPTAGSPPRPTNCGSIAGSRRWTLPPPCPALTTRPRAGTPPRRWLANGSWAIFPSASPRSLAATRVRATPFNATATSLALPAKAGIHRPVGPGLRRDGLLKRSPPFRFKE